MGQIWEIDFYSRPLLDENGKKRWELLVCESSEDVNEKEIQRFRYSQLCGNDQVNSIWLKDALAEAIAQAPTPPSTIRFFRRQMNNMVTRACQELRIEARISRRTFTVWQWLQQRLKDYYPQQPGYAPASNPSVQYEVTTPLPLPDALRGQQWMFVSLELEAFQDMPDWEIDFGEAFPLSRLDLAPKTPIPGVIIFSSRAKALAAWMSGLELATLGVEGQPAKRLVLETGISDRWILASFAGEETIIREATQFLNAKEKAQHVHFLAVQENPEIEAFAGFWLLQDLVLS